MYGKNITKSEDKARQRNIYAKKHLQNEMDVQREMERVHLTAIRHEKIKLQKEIERMKNKGQYMVKRHGASNHTQRLLKLRLTTDQKDQNGNQVEKIIEDQENQKRTRLGLPAIGGPMRRKSVANDGMTSEQRVILNRRKEAEKMQEALVARVGQIADEFKARNSAVSMHRRSISPIRRDTLSVKPDSARTAKSDGYNEDIRRRSRAKQNNRSSITDVDFTEAKNSVARRLLKSDSLKNVESNGNTDEETPTRKVSRVLPIEGAKTPEKNIPALQNAEDLVFDQEKFAPDGHVRTVHLLPSAEEAFQEAKDARYLRLTGGQGPNGKELSVDQIFAAGEDEVADEDDEDESVDEDIGSDTHESLNLGLLKH